MTRSIASLAALALAGCLAFVAPDDPIAIRDLVSARARWNLHGATAYTLRGSTQCFCVMGGREVDIEVLNGQVTRVTYADSGTPLPSELGASFRSVEQLFDIIDEAVRQDAHRIEVTYDPRRGFPTRLWIDWSERIADEEYGFVTTVVTDR
jgi:Family of unknown function (DUF6174)